MRREAVCHCGQLKVETTGEPLRVVICHCEACQRRTGSAFNLGIVFEESDLTLSGDFSVYRRQGELGLDIEFHFCPNCGSNVHWIYDGAHVVAGGCFADPDFATPTISIYGRYRHSWLHPNEGIPSYSGSRQSELE